MGPLQHLDVPGQVNQPAEHGGQFRLGDARGQLLHLIPGLALQRVEQRPLSGAVQLGGLHQSTIDAHMPQIQVHIGHPTGGEGFQHQRDDFDIAGTGGVAIQLGTQLNQAARGRQRARQGMQHAAAVAQAARPLGTQGVGIDAGHLGGDVRAQTKHPAGQAVGHLEGLQVKVVTGAGQQGFEVFDMRGDDQVIPPAGKQIQQLPTGCFGTHRLFGQHFFDPIRQQPAINSRHLQNLNFVSGSGTDRPYPPACSAGRPRAADDCP